MKTIRSEGASPFVLFCDHATNHVPVELLDLGLPVSELARHIAWDIGAAGVTEALSELLDAPAVFSGVSRLVIDCNRHIEAADLIPEKSDGTVIPGNLHLSQEARASRIERWFHPYHNAVEAVFLAREAKGVPSIAVSIHSMTPALAGIARPWQISLSSHIDRRLTDPVLACLRRDAHITVGDNQPYDMNPNMDYSTPHHAVRRGLQYVQVEFRQDEILDQGSQQAWARRLANALVSAISAVPGVNAK